MWGPAASQQPASARVWGSVWCGRMLLHLDLTGHRDGRQRQHMSLQLAVMLACCFQASGAVKGCPVATDQMFMQDRLVSPQRPARDVVRNAET